MQTNETRRHSLAALAAGAVGVVFGDIGTSPLYAMKETLGTHGMQPESGAILGVLSLIFWALIMVVSLKYVTFVMRADNKGEGGIMALMALAQRSMVGEEGYFLARGRKLVDGGHRGVHLVAHATDVDQQAGRLLGNQDAA